jgi:multidrug efflux system membrane fusion protein
MDRENADGKTVTQMEPAPARNRIPEPRPRSKYGWVIWLVVFAALGGGGYYYYEHYYKASANAAKPAGPAVRDVPVVVQTAHRGDLKIYLRGLGSVSALNTVTLHTRVDGQLDKVWFVEGQIVHEGDPIADIDPRAYKVQLTQAQGQKAKDQSLLDNANVDLKRFVDAGNSVSKQELATQQALVDQYKAALVIDQSAIDNANLNLAYCHITAPLTGKIGLRLVDQGNIVHASDPGGLAVITQLQPIAVVFFIPEDDLPKVLTRMKSPEPVEVAALDRDKQNQLATGTLQAVDNRVDPTSGTVQFKAIFPNEDNALFPNQFVNAQLLIDTVKDALLIPPAAIQRSPNSTFVYVVEKAGTVDKNGKPEKSVEMREIELGPIEGDVASITSGLAEGEVVVTDGVDKLMQDTKVSITQPAGSSTMKQDKTPATKSSTKPTTPTTTMKLPVPK